MSALNPRNVAPPLVVSIAHGFTPADLKPWGGLMIRHDGSAWVKADGTERATAVLMAVIGTDHLVMDAVPGRVYMPTAGTLLGDGALGYADDDGDLTTTPGGAALVRHMGDGVMVFLPEGISTTDLNAVNTAAAAAATVAATAAASAAIAALPEPSRIIDADANTSIDVERTADENLIVLRQEGVTRLVVGETGGQVHLGRQGTAGRFSSTDMATGGTGSVFVSSGNNPAGAGATASYISGTGTTTSGPCVVKSSNSPASGTLALSTGNTTAGASGNTTYRSGHAVGGKSGGVYIASGNSDSGSGSTTLTSGIAGAGGIPGTVNVQGGSSGAAGTAGGLAVFRGGSATSGSNADGGTTQIVGGQSDGSGTPGLVEIIGANRGGNIDVTGGWGGGTGNVTGGFVTIKGGPGSGTSQGGQVRLLAGANDSNAAPFGQNAYVSGSSAMTNAGHAILEGGIAANNGTVKMRPAGDAANEFTFAFSDLPNLVLRLPGGRLITFLDAGANTTI